MTFLNRIQAISFTLIIVRLRVIISTITAFFHKYFIVIYLYRYYFTLIIKMT